MADRKQFHSNLEADPILMELLEQAKTVKITKEMQYEQRVSFVYGNAPESSRVTKESARETVENLYFAPN